MSGLFCANLLNGRVNTKFFGAAAFSLVTAFALNACGAQAADNQRIFTPKHFGAGIDINGQPRAEETGLPLYPGAEIDRTDSAEPEEGGEGAVKRGGNRGGNRSGNRSGKQTNSDEEGVNLNLWFGSNGLKLVVVKLKTGDSIEQVSALTEVLYQNMARYLTAATLIIPAAILCAKVQLWV